MTAPLCFCPLETSHVMHAPGDASCVTPGNTLICPILCTRDKRDRVVPVTDAGYFTQNEQVITVFGIDWAG